MIKDQELLRNEYNMNYSKPIDRWSCHDLNQAKKIISQVLVQLVHYGLIMRKGLKSLDVGCAKGHITEALRFAGFKSFGLDYSDVAIQIASENFSNCHFIHMDGFNPTLDTTFDLIFCRGFSGANTHNLDFVAEWAKKYIHSLSPGGYFILAFSSCFSGKEDPGETVVNWSMAEIDKLSTMLPAKRLPMFFIPRRDIVWSFKKFIKRWVLRKKPKDHFYLAYEKKKSNKEC